MKKSDDEYLAFAETNKDLFVRYKPMLVLWVDFIRFIEDIVQAHAPTLLNEAEKYSPELSSALIECGNAYLECRKSLLLKRGRGSTGRTKQGRPTIWKGYEGWRLVYLVKSIREGKHCSIAHAIRLAIKTDPVLKSCEAVYELSDSALQVRYQEAVKYWSQYSENEAQAGPHWDAWRRLYGAAERLLATFQSLAPVLPQAALERLRAALQSLSATPEQQKQLESLQSTIKRMEVLIDDPKERRRHHEKTFRNEIGLFVILNRARYLLFSIALGMSSARNAPLLFARDLRRRKCSTN